MRQNPAFTDRIIADAYTVVAKAVTQGDTEVMAWFPEAGMEAIEYVLRDGIAFPEDFGYITENNDVSL